LRDVQGTRELDIDGTRYTVTREVVGDSSVYALEAAVRIGKLLGVPEADLAAFLAHPL
jgi:UDP-N-acetylmuramyl pentapeptide synthase